MDQLVLRVQATQRVLQKTREGEMLSPTRSVLLSPEAMHLSSSDNKTALVCPLIDVRGLSSTQRRAGV